MIYALPQRAVPVGPAVRLERDVRDGPVPQSSLDKDLPLGFWTRIGSRPPGYICMRNAHLIHLQDENRLLTPAEAKQLIRDGATRQIEGEKSEESTATPALVSAALNEKLDKALSLLNTFSNSLPEHRVDTSEADEYHALLETAQRELECDLSEYRIPESAIKAIEIPQSMSFDEWGNPASDYTPIYERFIPANVFKRKVDALISYLSERPF